MKKNLLLSLALMIACISAQAQVIITEIMYNNAGNDDLEFIELYNNSDTAIDLDGYSFTAGLTHTFMSQSIDANGFLLLAKDSIFFLNGKHNFMLFHTRIHANTTKNTYAHAYTPQGFA